MIDGWVGFSQCNFLQTLKMGRDRWVGGACVEMYLLGIPKNKNKKNIFFFFIFFIRTFGGRSDYNRLDGQNHRNVAIDYWVRWKGSL